jgi:uncharacterized RDD family membrane protein YckC
VTQDPLGDPGWYYADVPNRLMGYVIDAVILAILSFVGAVIISVVFGPVVTFNLSAEPHVSVNSGLAFANAGLGTAISALYFVVTWRRLGGSPGQRLLRMRVWAAPSGGSITLRQGIVRWLFVGLPVGVEAMLSVALSGQAETLLLSGLATWCIVLLVSTARDPMKRGFHDRIAGTVVIKSARSAPWANDIDTAGSDVR